MLFFFLFNVTATTEIYTFPYTTLFRSLGSHADLVLRRAARADHRTRARREEHGRVAPAHAHRRDRSVRHRAAHAAAGSADRKSTRLNSSHVEISYAVFCLKKKNELSRK